MRAVAILCTLTLAGCAGSIVDPAPYRPEADRKILNSQAPPYNQLTLRQFDDLTDAAYKLNALATGYSNARDNIMREQLLFDVPAIGLGVATVANGVFRGAKDATIALGLSSATLAGTRLYFGPQVKVTAYNNAASALNCASSVAVTMDAESRSDGKAAASLADELTTYLSLADDLIVSGKLSKQDSTDLLAARDTAQKSVTDVNNSLSTLDTAPARLQAFAGDVIKAATVKVVTGTQNIDAVLTLVKNSGSSTPPPAKGIPPAAAPAKGAAPSPSAPEVASKLRSLAATAAPINKRINDVWSSLTNCSNTS
jgi:hypothetical protein